MIEKLKVSGMENAVTAAALDDDVLVTTSTGVKDASDGVSGYAVRLWKNGQLTRTLHNHYASVRCCCPFYREERAPNPYGFEGKADGFITGANDGKVIVCNSDGDVEYMCETSANVALRDGREA